MQMPLCAIRILVNEALAGLNEMFSMVYANGGRASVAPEKLLRAIQDAALTILEHEGVLASESVWVRGPDVLCSAPGGMLATIDAKGSGVNDLVSALGARVD